MAFEVKFQNGKTASFQNRPTDKDIDEVAKQMGIQPQQQAQQPKKEDGLAKTARVLDTVFGAGKVGEAISTGLIRGKTRRTLRDNGFSREEAKQQAKEFVSGPSAKEVIGSAAKSASLFVPVGRIAKGVGTAAKAVGVGSKLAKGAGAVTAGAGAGLAFDAAEALETGGPLKPTAATIGGALPIAGGVLRGAGKLTGALGKNLAAGVSGKGGQIIDSVLQNPQAARQGLRGMATLQKSATNVRQSVSKLAREASEQFADDLGKLPPVTGKRGSRSIVTVAGKPIELSTQGIKSKITKVLREFDVLVDPKKGKLDFTEAALDRAEGNRLQEVYNVVRTWKDTTPSGIHKLAKKVSNFRKSGEQSKQLNAIIDTVSRNARDYLGDRVPQARDMLKKFHDSQDIINALNQELGTKGSKVGGIAERVKTEKKIANLFSGEKESAIGLLESQVPEGADILGQTAGRSLRDISRASSSIGDLPRAALNVVLPPRLVGEIVAATGIARNKVLKIAEALKPLDEATRAAVINLLASPGRQDDVR